MDQEKIGKFIAMLRKEKNLTQIQLAEKLNITNRAVSKWERGLSMPDTSIMLELCKILDISVNELLLGERIEEKDLKNTSEINLVKALTIVEKQKNKVKKFLIIAVFVIFIALGAYLFYHNAWFPLDYNRTLVECEVEDGFLKISDYRECHAPVRVIINDDENNKTYVFYKSIILFDNYVGMYDDLYEHMGYILKSKSNSPRCITSIENTKFKNDNIEVYYTKKFIPENYWHTEKDIGVSKLSSYLKKSTLMYTYTK